MLPTEAFDEVVAFLRLSELDALLVSNSLCSSLALKASSAIRWQEFPGLQFYVTNRWIDILRQDDEDGQYGWNRVAKLTFRSQNETAEFIAAAFPNCVFQDFAIHSYPNLNKLVADSIDQVANSVIIQGLFGPPYNISHENVVTLARKFRKVKVSFCSYASLPHYVYCSVVSPYGGGGKMHLWA